MVKTFFEVLGDIAEEGQIIEQKIRLCIANKADIETLITDEQKRHRIAVLNRYERLLRRELNRMKIETINKISSYGGNEKRFYCTSSAATR